MATISHDKVGCTESGNTILKNIGQVNFEFLEIHKCPEEAKIGFKQLLDEFGDLIVPF